MPIHPTAIIDPAASVDPDNEIGPYTLIGPGVNIGPGNRVGAHAVFEGMTTIGRGNRFGNFVSVGAPPQDIGYKGEPTRLVVGDENFFGDYVQLCRGTPKGATQTTTIGNHVYLMAYCHVGHDCIVGDHVIAANALQLAGHVTVEDRAVFGGLVAIHQFARVGRMAMISGGSVCSLDVPPFCRAAGYSAPVKGLNAVGLRRNGFSREQIARIREAYRVVFRTSLTTEQAMERLEKEFADSEAVQHWVKFFRSTKRGVVRLKGASTADED